MSRETAIILAVTILGYSLYGGVLFAGAAPDLTGTASANDGVPSDQSLATPAPDAGPGADASGGGLGFREVAVDVGLNYTSVETYSGTKELMSNTGAYAADYDNDGWTDVLAVGGERPVLFRNVDGEFRRSDALPAPNATIRAALFFDHDNDGWEDLLLLSGGRAPVLLANDGGEYRRSGIDFGEPLAVPIGAAAGDFDRDGCPDLFVIQNGDWLSEHPNGLRNYSVPEGADNGNPNVLYRGTCGTFERATDAGNEGAHWSLATSFADLNGDGRPDIHVANDFNRDVVYLNRGDGTFERRSLGDRTNRNGMSSEVGDVDGDGDLDVFVTNIYYPPGVNDAVNTTMDVRGDGNNLLVNRGNGTFDERSEEFGVREGGWGWAAALADFDNDMDPDLFHTTRWISFKSSGTDFSRERIREIRSTYRFYTYPVVWRHDDDGFTRLVSSSVGLKAGDGRGVARLDFDRDGDVDLIVADATGGYANGRFAVYENTLTGRTALEVVVRGNGATPLGARVRVTAGNRTQVRELTSNSDYLSQDSRVLHFGTGTEASVDVRVTWPDGTVRTFEGVSTGQRVSLSPDGVERVDRFSDE